jgi:hypothetical protein
VTQPWLPLVVLTVGIGLTGTAAWLLHPSARHEADRPFDQAVEQWSRAIEDPVSHAVSERLGL